MESFPFITVALPVYNVEHVLEECIQSLLSQTYPCYEILLIDDGSSSACASLCDALSEKEDRIIVLHKENGGVSSARNAAVKAAKGEYLSFVDPDDLVTPEYLEILYTVMQTYDTEISAVSHEVHYQNGRHSKIGPAADLCLQTEEALERLLYHDGVDTACWGKLYKKTLFENISYPEGMIFEDAATTYKLILRAGKMAMSSQVCYFYQFHDNSIVNSQFHPHKLDLVTASDQMARDLLYKYPGLKEAILRHQAYARFSTINQMLYTSGYDKEREELIGFILKNKWDLLQNPKLPKRDQLAVLLITFHYPLYRRLWILYRRYIMGDFFWMK